MMEIKRCESDLLRSNMYVITENGHAIVIDPCRDIGPGEGLAVDLLLLTHEHYDHISGVNVWKERYHAPLLCSEACGKNIQSSRKSLSRFFDVFCEMQTWIQLDEPPAAEQEYTCMAEYTFRDRMTFLWQGHTLELMELPGHSGGSGGILVDGKDFFSGDSLMECQEVELRFPGGSAKQWEAVAEPRIKALPSGIKVWPGHFEGFIWENIRKDG